MLEDKEYKVNLNCIFCKATIFELPYEGYQPNSGELIRCANCGNANDFTSINNLAINKTLKVIEKDIQNEILSMFKKAGFKVK